jgi:hypothetical protein
MVPLMHLLCPFPFVLSGGKIGFALNVIEVRPRVHGSLSATGRSGTQERDR